MKRAIRALLFWGFVFSEYAVAGEVARVYTEQEMLDVLALSRRYAQLLEGHIVIQDQLIAELTGRLEKIYEPEMQLEASTGGSDIEEIKK